MLVQLYWKVIFLPFVSEILRRDSYAHSCWEGLWRLGSLLIIIKPESDFWEACPDMFWQSLWGRSLQTIWVVSGNPCGAKFFLPNQNFPCCNLCSLPLVPPPSRVWLSLVCNLPLEGYRQQQDLPTLLTLLLGRHNEPSSPRCSDNHRFLLS